MTEKATELIIAAAIEVHRILGPGLLESIYEKALCFEFDQRKIPFERQKEMDVVYKGHLMGKQRTDLICFNLVIVEVKAQRPNEELFLAQSLSYLKFTGLKRALVLNFGLSTLKKGIQRISADRPSWKREPELADPGEAALS